MRASRALFLLAFLTGGTTTASVAQDNLALEPLLHDENVAAAPGAARPASDFSSSERRLPGGRVTEIEIQSRGSRYTIQPQTPAGGARGEGGTTVRWNILNFDGPVRTDRNDAQQPARAPVPPPPRAD